MSGPNTAIQYSFSTGVVSPGVRGRKDWQRIDSAIAVGLNGVITPTGAFRKRPGMRFVNACLHDNKPITQVTFEFSREQVYELEFGDYLVRFYSNGGLVTNSSGVPYIISSPYSAQQATEFTCAQERDALFVAHWDKPLKRLVRYGHTNWVWEDVFTDASTARLPSPTTLTWYDNASNGHNGYEYAVTAYRMVSGTPQESISPPTLLSDPSSVDSINETPQATIQSCITWIKRYKAGYGHLAGFPTYPEEFDLSDVTEDAQPTSGQYLHPKVFAIFKKMYPGAYYGYRNFYYSEGAGGERWRIHWAIYGPNPASETDYLWNVYYGQISSGSFNLENFHIYQEFADRVAAYNYTWIMLTQAYDWINANAVSSNGQTMSSVYGAITSFIATYNQNHSAKISNHVAWPAVAGANGYYVYRRPINTQDKKFYLIADINNGALHYLEPDVTQTIPNPKTPIEGINQFTTPDSYPALCTFYQQRLVLGCTKAKPTTLFGSRTGIYTDFSINASDLASGYEFKMASQQSNPLKWILPLYTLAVLTSGGDFISTVTGAMNAANVNFNQKSYNGCSTVKPIIVGDNALYVPVSQQTINSMTYSYEKDGFAHVNILFHAQHYAKDRKIVGLSYQRDPINLIWALLDDGTLLSCTYIPQQDFVSWTEHYTEGKVKSINSVPNSEGYDDLYLVVERTLGNGTKKQYLEMLDDVRPYGKTPDAENAFFVDCGLSGKFEAPKTVITGLGHLEGLVVAVLADGSVLDDRKVMNGSIMLDQPAYMVHAGLPYRCHMKTLKFDLVNQGTLRNTRSQINECVAELEDTRELRYSANGGDWNDLTVHDADELGIPKLQNGDFELRMRGRNSRGAYVEFESKAPVPCTIVSIVAEVSHGDS